MTTVNQITLLFFWINALKKQNKQTKKNSSLLNGVVAHLKTFPRLKAKQLNHYPIPVLEEYEHDAFILNKRFAKTW